MAAEIVHDDDVAGLKRRYQDLLDVGPEDVAIDGAVDDQRGGETAGAQCCDERRCFPVTVRHRRDQALTARGAPVAASQVGGRPGLIDEDQPVRI